MNIVIKSIAVTAIALCAASVQASAAESSATAESSSPKAAQKIAQANTRFSPISKARASEFTETGSFDSGKRGARAAAEQGPEVLRRYVDRTRMIYGLDYYEFAKP